MKKDKIENKNEKELYQEISQLKKEQFNFRMQRVAGAQISLKRVREVKKMIAQIFTEINKRSKLSK